MRNSDGKYVATRYMKATGTLLTGVGETIQEARLVLKNQVQKYNEGMSLGVHLIPTGEKILSPGVVFHKTDSGSVYLKQDDRREIQVKARPELAKYIQGGRKDNVLKESRQIRRARLRDAA